MGKAMGPFRGRQNVEEEIDLREYIEVIVRRWRWIAGITLVAVITAAIVSFFLMAPIYEAKAGVVIVKSKSEITFEPKYRTLSEEDLARAGLDIKARRQALEALVKSSSVAAEVIAKLGPMLEPEERDASALLGMVETEMDGDLIGIKVRGKDPKKITAIANAWGEAYESYVNELYGGRAQSPTNIQAQVAEAKKTYQQAEEALARFMGDNKIQSLAREIEAKQQALADYYATKQKLDRLIADARALREKLREGSASRPTANSLSILLLQANAFVASTNLPLQPFTGLPIQQPTDSFAQPSSNPPPQPLTSLPLQLQLSLDEMADWGSTVEEQLGDLDALISVLEARREEVGALIGEGSLQQEILKLQEQLEREQACQRELTQARDLAWETYQTLARKEAEVQVATQVRDTEVRFAVPAVEPKYPVAPKKKLNIAIAGVLGLMVGVFGAFMAEYVEGWKSEGK